MRILHVMSWYVPDMGYQENSLTIEQKKLGHDVAIACGASIPASCLTIPRFSGKALLPYGVSYERGIAIHRLASIDIRSLSLIFGLDRVLCDIEPDVVHAHGALSPATFTAITLSKRHGYRVFVDEHGLGLSGAYSRPIDKAYANMCRATYKVMGRRVSCFLPVTYSSIEVLKTHLGVPEDRMELLPLGADTRVFDKSQENRWKTRGELGITDDQTLFISSGKFVEEKLIHVLVRAFSEVVALIPTARLLFVGCWAAEYQNRIEDLLDELGLREFITFSSFVPNIELPRFYAAADVGVWPGLPSITALEAASTGLPIVVPSNEMAYRVLLDRESAVGYIRENCESLAQALKALALNRTYRLSVGEAAYLVMRQELSWERIARRSIELYESRR